MAAGDRKPRLGFLGLGWIGRHRLAAVHEAGIADIVVLGDSSPASIEAALAVAPEAATCGTLEACLAYGLDAIVIATPSGLHAAQALTALEAGCAVFCQKPLARTAAETSMILSAAARLNRPFGVDFAYRHTAAMAALAPLIERGDLGDVFAANFTFHNAYGPGQPWCYEPEQSGGGCLIDLGSHLMDLALWFLPGEVDGVTCRLFRDGHRLEPSPTLTEDYASVRIDFETGAVAEIACSWRLALGQDALVVAEWFGTKGGARLANVGGSFYDFTADRLDGRSRIRLADPPDAWGGRAIVRWVQALVDGEAFDRALGVRLQRGAAVMDAAYGRHRESQPLVRSAWAGEAACRS